MMMVTRWYCSNFIIPSVFVSGISTLSKNSAFCHIKKKKLPKYGIMDSNFIYWVVILYSHVTFLLKLSQARAVRAPADAPEPLGTLFIQS